MARKLTNLKVDMISLVKNPANGEKVTIFKSADHPAEADTVETTTPAATAVEETPAEEVAKASAETESQEVTPSAPAVDDTAKKGVMKSVKEFLSNLFGEPVEVHKAQDIDDSMDWSSFNSMISNPRRNTFKACYVLEDVLSEIFWNDTIENGKELIAQNIDEFKAYVMKILDGPVDVAKTQFAEAFTSKENLGMEEDDMTAEQIAKAVSDALAPVTKSVEDLLAKVDTIAKSEETPATEGAEATPAAEGAETPAAEGTETPAEGGEGAVAKSVTPEDVAEVIKSALEPVVKSVGELTDKVQALENVRPVSKSAEVSGVSKSAGTVDEWPELTL